MADPDDPPPPDDADAPAPAPDEPRAGDIARAKSTADLDEKLDPKTVAQLAAWFGLPSYEELEEQQRKAAEPPFDQFAEYKEKLAKLAEHIDPTMLELLDRHTPRGDRMLGNRLPPPMESIVRDLAKFDAKMAESLRNAIEPTELERPDWIDEAMEENTPQAILRDLHRPEDTYGLGYPLPDPVPGMQQLTGDIRAIATASYKITPNEPTGSTSIRASLADLTYWMAQDWGIVQFPKMATPPAKDENQEAENQEAEEP